MTQNSLPLALVLLVAVVTRADEAPTHWGPIVKGLQMSSRLEKSEYRSDEPVMLEVAIKNTSKEVVSLGWSADDQASFEIAVNYVGGGLAPAGRMPLTKYGAWRFAPSDATKNVEIFLKAGEERRYRFPLRRMYDMTLQGNYSVVVNRLIPGQMRYDTEGHIQPIEGPRPDELVSNSLTVVISGSTAQEY